MTSKSDIIKLVEMIDELWCECDKMNDKLSHQYLLNRKKIERLKLMIKPCGTVKKPQLTESKCLICQFRYKVNSSNHSKNFKPHLYDVVYHALMFGDNQSEIIKLIEFKGDRQLSLGNDYEWVIKFEEELINHGL